MVEGSNGREKASGMSLTAVLRDLNKLNTFVRVAERRSFTRAAADLRTTPSVVSKRMRELEEALGISLLSRSTHGIVLTDAGEGLFRTFVQMLATLDDYVVDARNSRAEPVGTLRVQAQGEFARCVLTPLIADFSRAHPGLRVHLSVMSDYDVASDDVFDVIIASEKPSIPGLAEIDLGAVPFVVCASPDYFRRHGRPGDPRELRDHNCLANQYFGLRNWEFRQGSRSIHVEVKGSLSSDNYAVLVQLALRGCGIIRVPGFAVAEELKRNSLESLFAESVISSEKNCIYFSKTKFVPSKIANFVDFIRAELLPAAALVESAGS